MKVKTWSNFFLAILLFSTLALGANYNLVGKKKYFQQQITSTKKINTSDENQLKQTVTYKNLQLGESFTGVIATDIEDVDHLYLWGYNKMHRVSESKKLSEPTPIEKTFPETKIKLLALGKKDNAAAVTTDLDGNNHLYMWGYDEYGETGKGSLGVVRYYREIKLQDKIIKNISLGYHHSAIVTTDQKDEDHLYLMGANNYGQLGTASRKNIYKPQELNFFETKIKDLSLGYHHSSVVTTDQNGYDHLYLWGNNDYNQIGNGKSINQKYPTKIALPENKIKKASLGFNHSGAITTDQNGKDHLYLWGAAQDGQLGSLSSKNIDDPLELNFPELKIKDLSLGFNHSSVVTTDQNGKDYLYLWGNNKFGQIGTREITNQPQPIKIPLSETEIKEISLGYKYSGIIATNKNGQDVLYLWGDNHYGQLGDGDVAFHHHPLEVPFSKDLIQQVSLGYKHSSVLTTNQNGNNLLYLWGDNDYGQIGNGETNFQDHPIKIALPENKIKKVSLGFNHSSVITSDQSGKDHLYLWGNNWSGQIGNGKTTNQNRPLKIPLLENKIKDLSLGYHHSSVVTTDQEGKDHLYLWGNNYYGQLGYDKAFMQAKPVKVSLSETKIKELSLGFNHSSVVTTDQSGKDHLYLWGDNRDGQLGTGDNINRDYPTEVILPETKIKKVDLNASHSSVITIDKNGKNHLYLWGNNHYAQLGNGNTINQNKPIKLPLAQKDIQEVSLGHKHASVITTDQTGKNHLYLWGDNLYGQLGDGNTIKGYQPIEVLIPENKINHLSLSNYHSAFITTNQNGASDFYSWGDDYYDHLGFRCQKFKSTPMQISNIKEPKIFSEIKLQKLSITNNQANIDLIIRFDDFNLITSNQVQVNNMVIYLLNDLKISYLFSKIKNNVLAAKIKIDQLIPDTNYFNLSFNFADLSSGENRQITIPPFATLG